MISGIYTAILLILFVGIIVWAWSDKRKPDFEHLSNLPLEDETEETKGDENGHE